MTYSVLGSGLKSPETVKLIEALRSRGIKATFVTDVAVYRRPYRDPRDIVEELWRCRLISEEALAHINSVFLTNSKLLQRKSSFSRSMPTMSGQIVPEDDDMSVLSAVSQTSLEFSVGSDSQSQSNASVSTLVKSTEGRKKREKGRSRKKLTNHSPLLPIALSPVSYSPKPERSPEKAFGFMSTSMMPQHDSPPKRGKQNTATMINGDLDFFQYKAMNIVFIDPLTRFIDPNARRPSIGKATKLLKPGSMGMEASDEKSIEGSIQVNMIPQTSMKIVESAHWEPKRSPKRTVHKMILPLPSAEIDRW